MRAQRFVASILKLGVLRLIIAFSLAVWTQIVLFGLGKEPAAWIDTAQSIFFMAVIFFLLCKGKFSRILVPELALLLAIAWPVRAMVGPLVTIPNVETMLGTTVTESMKFLANIPMSRYALPMLLAFVVSVAVFKSSGMSILARKTRLIAYGLLVLCIPVFLSVTHLDSVGYFTYKLLAAQHNGVPMSWNITGRLPQAKPVQNYILVMGESLRRDAMHLYGNPYLTTPFLDSVPTKVLERPVSPAGGTMNAVPMEMSLSSKEGDPEPQNNVVALAKAAGMKTYWLSSQNRVHNLTIPFAVIAETAEYRWYAPSNDDFLVVEEFARILEEKADKARFFVINTYGSHEPVCERVVGFEKPFTTGVKAKDWKVPFLASDNFFDCYLASALKADRVVEGLVKAVEEKGESYSLIFTSDHASSFFYRDEEFNCCRFPEMKALYEVPFVEIGTNVKASQRFDALRSTKKLAHYFPTWIGVTTDRTEEGYDIFTAPSEQPAILDMDGHFAKYEEAKDSASFKDFLLGL